MANEAQVRQAEQAYIAARDALRAVMMEYEDDEILDEASQAFSAVRRAYVRATNESFANRTRLLRTLVHRLREIVDDVERDPIGDVADQVNQALKAAEDALSGES